MQLLVQIAVMCALLFKLYTMQQIPFNQLEFRQLPLDRILRGLPKNHPLYLSFESYKQQMRPATDDVNESVVAIIHITMALELAAFEN